jgi:hypothetical protein
MIKFYINDLSTRSRNVAIGKAGISVPAFALVVRVNEGTRGRAEHLTF